MEAPKNSLTPAQQRAVAARGNVLVMAGAGTGKTKTLVARCLDCLARDGAQIDELLIVTFTEAAAAEMRSRLRAAIETKIEVQSPKPKAQNLAPDLWPEQLARFDLAHIGTLHSFCLKLVREHFYELGLDPQFALLDEGEARQLANETLDEIFQNHYADEDEFSRAVQNLIQIYGNGRDEKIRALVLHLHHYSQTRPDADGWLAQQIQKFSITEPTEWQNWLLTAIQEWRDEWLSVLENLKSENEKAIELTDILSCLPKNFSREIAAEFLDQILSADGNWPAKRKTVLRKPLENIFAEAKFLHSLAAIKNGNDPLVEDWNWIRGHMKTLVELAREFSEKFSGRKLADGVLDFHDLEQFALKLLWNLSTGQPTDVAKNWRAKLKFIFVDEYQDINAAQDQIIAAISRDERWGETPSSPNIGNRFLVGDVKQSIYRFRLADPKIFRDYAKNWFITPQQSEGGHDQINQVIPLSENFRSAESLLDFVNSIFRLVMREEIGGVNYDADAELKFGQRSDENQITDEPTKPRTELLLRFKKNRSEEAEADDENKNGDLADLDDAQKEARLVATRLLELKNSGLQIRDEAQKKSRAVEWRDIAILLRSPSAKSEIYVQAFERAGVPLSVAPGGFYESAEILDLLSLLQLLDNPLRDVPCIAVLRSPLVGLSLDELAEIRLALKDGNFWTALNRVQSLKSNVQSSLAAKIEKFLERFSRWRKLAKQVSLSQCLEEILAETYYADWLKAQPRGEQRAANVTRFLQLTQSFDQFQRQGLFRFLKFIAAQRETETEPEVPAVAAENAVRLLSIHQSKGLEFPVVVVADLAKNFNEQDLRSEIILDEQFGLCPRVKPPHTGQRYPSLPHWLAQKNQRRELRGEELRLLYVAFTRAREHLILTASISEKSWTEKWQEPQIVTVQKIAAAKNFADWLALWFSVQRSESSVEGTTHGEFENLSWQIVQDEKLLSASTDEADDSILRSENKFSKSVGPLDSATEEKLRAVLEWNYPHAAATQQKAKSSVTVLRRAAEELDDEAEQTFAPKFRRRRPAGTFAQPKTKLNAAEIGAAHHKFLQHVALDKTGDLKTEAERLVRENYLSAEEAGVLDFAALKQFFGSALGKKISAQPAGCVRRELPFTARFSPAEIEKIIGGKTEGNLAAREGSRPTTNLENEFVVVQGVADLVVLRPQEIWLVDFKTDDVRAGELGEKIKIYKPQLQFYAAALEKIFARQVTLCALHFLSAQKTVEV